MDASGSLLTCLHCRIHVHPLCYQTLDKPGSDDWWCLPCRIYHERQRDLQIQNTGLRSGGAYSVECKVCPNRGGAFQKTADAKRWIHCVCRAALSDPVTKATAAIKRCSICGKAKGKVFPCQTRGCDAMVHTLCARTSGKLTIMTQQVGEETKMRIQSLLCRTCAVKSEQELQIKESDCHQSPQRDRKEQSIEAEKRIPAVNTKQKVRLRPETSPSHGSANVLSEEEHSAGRVANRTRAKRQKLDPEVKRPGRRGRPKKQSSQSSLPPPIKKRPDPTAMQTPHKPKTDISSEATSRENNLARRLTRSMR